MESQHSRQHRILYIDCDPPPRGLDGARSAWLRDVQAEDFDLIIAAPGECGVGLACRCRPDLILLELGLSRSSGVVTVTQLRESSDTYLIPIVALSTRACQNVPGLSMYCQRPINTPEFLAMVRVLLGRTLCDGKAETSAPSALVPRAKVNGAKRCLAGARPLRYRE